jgi:membrane-associated phospholipid phosphatase
MVAPLLTPIRKCIATASLCAFVLFATASCSSAPGNNTIARELSADLEATFFDTENLIILGGGFGAVMLLDGSYGGHTEDRVAHFFTNNDVVPDRAGRTLDFAGSGLFLLSAAGAWYGGTQFWGNAQDEQASLAMISALGITGVTTITLKTLMNDGRPNGAAGGFPSGHSSMAMAAASSLGTSYGWKVGLPAYLTAVAIGVQRLDSRKHDLDDVLGGFALGYVVGSAVAGRRLPSVMGGELQPIIDPVGGEMGLVVAWDF